MKYLVVQFQAPELVCFPEEMDHSTAWQLVQDKTPGCKLISAGKLYVEPQEGTDHYYVQLNPGSFTLRIEPRTPEEHQTHYNHAFSALPKTELELFAASRRIFSRHAAFTHLTGRSIFSKCSIKWEFLPVEYGCPTAKVTLTGLASYDDEFFFWQAFRRM